MKKIGRSFEEEAIGDFYGNGYGSVLFLDTDSKRLGIWKDPILSKTGNASPYTPIYQMEPTDGRVAGVGDFNYRGSSDVLLRDTKGNLEIVSFTNNTTASHDFDVYSLFNSTTADFNKRWKTPANGAAGVLWHFLKITNDKRSRVLCPRYEPMAQQRLGAETCPKPELRSRFSVDSAKVRNTQLVGFHGSISFSSRWRLQ